MEAENARILVIGAGVNGSLCAVALHKAGFNVTVLARGQRYEEVKDQGIIIADPFRKERSITRVPVIPALQPEDVYEYVLVIVRKNQVPDLLPVLARNRSPNVVFMVNNPSGPDIFTNALPRERILLGFPFGAGKREAGIIHGFLPKANPRNGSPFGELDGSLSPRLTRLVAVFNHAGLPARSSTDISGYLARHAAVVAPLAHMLILHHCDIRRMARHTSDLFLLVNALHDALDVLEALGVALDQDRMARLLRRTPRFILVLLLRILIPTRYMEVCGAWHCMQAPDEMRQLGLELMALVQRSGLPAPALRRLFASGS